MSRPGPVYQFQAHGRPRITRTTTAIRVEQRRIIGWAMLAFGLALPGLVLFAERARILRDPGGYLAWAVDGLNGIEWVGASLMALMVLFLVGYGLIWILWTRRLVVDLNLRRYEFVTGFRPWLARYSGSCDTRVGLQLFRKTIRETRPEVGPGTLSGQVMESWELRIALPGSREPLFLGEWGLHDEARVEAGLWQKTFPNAIMQDSAGTQSTSRE